jgi:hypothetical protein
LLAVSVIIAGVLISSRLSADTNSEMYLFNNYRIETGLVPAYFNRDRTCDFHDPFKAPKTARKRIETVAPALELWRGFHA